MTSEGRRGNRGIVGDDGGLMELGKYIDDRALTYDERTGTFKVGEAPVSANQVRGYSAAGQIAWAGPGMASWFDANFPARPEATLGAATAKKPAGLVIAIIAGVLVFACAVCGIVAALTPLKKAINTAGTSNVTSAATPNPTPQPTPIPAPVTPAPEKTVYKAISTSDFAELAQNPDAYSGQHCIVYGEVTQFDSATGDFTLRANTGATKKKIESGAADYRVNSILSGTKEGFAKLADGDVFSANVTILGSFSYDNQGGEKRTVPSFLVDSIQAYGSTAN